jgi:hypothetical protein
MTAATELQTMSVNVTFADLESAKGRVSNGVVSHIACSHGGIIYAFRATHTIRNGDVVNYVGTWVDRSGMKQEGILHFPSSSVLKFSLRDHSRPANLKVVPGITEALRG